MSPLAIALNALSLAWKAYQYAREKIDLAELAIAKEKLWQAIEALKLARTPEAKRDANKRIISDVINRLG